MSCLFWNHWGGKWCDSEDAILIVNVQMDRITDANTVSSAIASAQGSRRRANNFKWRYRSGLPLQKLLWFQKEIADEVFKLGTTNKNSCVGETE